MKKLLTILVAAACMAACNNASDKSNSSDANTAVTGDSTHTAVKPAQVDTTLKTDSPNVEKAVK